MVEPKSEKEEAKKPTGFRKFLKFTKYAIGVATLATIIGSCAGIISYQSFYNTPLPETTLLQFSERLPKQKKGEYWKERKTFNLSLYLLHDEPLDFEPLSLPKKLDWNDELALKAGAYVMPAMLGVGDTLASQMELTSLCTLPSDLQPAIQQQRTEIYDAQGVLLAIIENRRQKRVTLDEISDYLQDAVIAIEDKTFYQHQGVDKKRFSKAAWQEFIEGHLDEGGSTITQQLAKNLFLTRERSHKRKAEEILLALQLEERFSKTEILEGYLNSLFMGEVNYGVEAASLSYLGKHSSDVTLGEAALLAGVIHRPNNYDLRTEEGRTKAYQRRKDVLVAMYNQGKISYHEMMDANLERVETLHEQRRAWHNPGTEDIVTLVMKEMQNIFGEDWLTLGATVQTSIDSLLQQRVRNELIEESNAIVRSEGGGHPEGCTLIIDPNTGMVVAAVGSIYPTLLEGDTTTVGYRNRLFEPRQTGSIIKPFVYAWLFEEGALTTPDDLVQDIPLSFPGAGKRWVINNYSGGNSGAIPASLALAKSVNCAAVHSAAYLRKDENGKRYGVVDNVEALKQFLSSQMQFSTIDVEDRLPLVLGGFHKGIKPIELFFAMSAFANQGSVHGVAYDGQLHPNVIALVRINGKEYTLPQEEHHIVSEHTALCIRSMMEQAVDIGTCYRNHQDIVINGINFKVPTAGKTGTSDSFKESWQVMYYTPAKENELRGPSLLVGSLVCFDQNLGKDQGMYHTGINRNVTGSTGAGNVNGRILHYLTEKELRPLEQMTVAKKE